MPKRIQYEGKTHVFPDDFSESDISAALTQDSRSRMTADQRQGSSAMGAKPPKQSMAEFAAGMRESMTPDNAALRMISAPFREVVVRPFEGMGQAGQGLKRIGQGDWAGGASDIIRGGMQMAAPMMPVAIATAPLAAAGGVAGGVLGSKVGGGLARAVDAPQGVVELAETGGGLLGGYAGAKGLPAAVNKAADYGKSAYNTAQQVKRFVKENPGLAKDVVGMASPRAAHAVGVAEKVMNVADKVGTLVDTAKAAQKTPTIAPEVPEVKPSANGLEVVQPPVEPHVPLAQPSVDWRNPTSAGELSTAIRKGIFPEGSRWDGSKVVLPATEKAAYEAMRPSNVDAKVILQEDGMPLMKAGTEPPGEASTFDTLLGNVRAKLEAEGVVPKGYKWGRGDAGGTLQQRFEEGSGAPIIDSSKSRFNGPVANPMRLKPGQPEQVIAKIEALAEPTEPQLLLVEQMKKEIARRASSRTKAPAEAPKETTTQPAPSAALMQKIMSDPKLAKAALDFAEMMK